MKYEKTHHALTRNGKNFGHFQTDTIFIDSIPHLVLEWVVSKDGSEKPAHEPIKLIPEKHHVINWEKCKYLYELPIEDPRKFH